MRFLIVLIFSLALFSSCYRGDRDITGWEFGKEDVDSLSFLKKHHYGVNYNFEVKSDSLVLETDSLERDAVGTSGYVVRKGDLLVVADVAITEKDSMDSVYVKVAHDQSTIGWVREKDLLSSAVPDDPVSKLIDDFSRINVIVVLFAAVFGISVYLIRLGLRKSVPMVFFNDIQSPYPSLLCVLVSFAACFYGTLQGFFPYVWVDYYFHPSLNPFSLPAVMGCLVACLWIIVIVAMASFEEILTHLSFPKAVVYMTGLLSFALVCYLVFSILTPLLLGYPLMVAFAVLWLRRSRKVSGYRCGRCGAVLPSRTCRCPSCGAVNE